MATAAHSSPPPTPPYVSPSRKTPSPTPEASRSRRSPSPETCPICLDVLDEKKDRSFSDNCSHAFCFICLLEWSKNKRECPLCKKSFTAIIHRYKSHDDFKLHELPPPAPVARNHLFAHQLEVSFDRMRQIFMDRRRQRDATRHNWNQGRSLPQRSSSIRPATADYRRFVYTYGLYCEGATPPGGALRYRMVTPSFYRRNPAIVHRLIPWLNRELVAILSHRDNVQFVLDHIISEIKRVDLRSPEFRASIQPFILANTDHFIHEFHQFAMSPLDMAGFDRYAQYPRQPHGMRTRPHPQIPNAQIPHAIGTGQANVTQPPRSSSSSSDSDVEIQTPQHHSTQHHATPATLSLSNSSRSRVHASLTSDPTASTSHPSPLDRAVLHSRRSRWDTAVPPLSSQASRYTRTQRTDLNRLQRSLMSVDGAGSSVNYFHPPGLTAPPDTTHIRQLITRVQDLLGGAASSSSAALDMPLLSDLTGETAPAPSAPLPSLLPGSEQPVTPAVLRPEPIITDWSDVYQARPSAPISSAPPRSPASSHSSDVILVHEEKPFRERTPVELSDSDSSAAEDKVVKPKVFKATLSIPLRTLSASSDSSHHSGETVTTTNQRVGFRSPDLSDKSDTDSDLQSSAYRRAGMIDPTTDTVADTSQSSAVSQRKAEDAESSDSDCVVTFEAAKVGTSLKRKSDTSRDKEERREKRSKHRHSEKSKEHRHSERPKEHKHSERPKEHRRRRSSRSSSPADSVQSARSESVSNKDRRKHKHKKHHRGHRRPRVSSPDSSPATDHLVSAHHKRKSDAESSSYSHCHESATFTSSNIQDVDQQNRSTKSGEDKSMSTNNLTDDTTFYLDYSNDGVEREDQSEQKQRGFRDVRKHLRYYAKTKLTEKYLDHDKKCKKHDKGHKRS